MHSESAQRRRLVCCSAFYSSSVKLEHSFIALPLIYTSLSPPARLIHLYRRCESPSPSSSTSSPHPPPHSPRLFIFLKHFFSPPALFPSRTQPSRCIFLSPWESILPPPFPGLIGQLFLYNMINQWPWPSVRQEAALIYFLKGAKPGESRVAFITRTKYARKITLIVRGMRELPSYALEPVLQKKRSYYSPFGNSGFTIWYLHNEPLNNLQAKAIMIETFLQMRCPLLLQKYVNM